MNVLGIRDGKRGEQFDVVKRMFKLVLLYDYLLLITCAGENDEQKVSERSVVVCVSDGYVREKYVDVLKEA